MAKKPQTIDADTDEDFNFDFSEILASDYQDESMGEIVETLITASNHHADTTYNLTQLIVDKQAGSLSVKDILSIYQQAAVTVADNSLLKPLWERLHLQD